MVRVGIVGPTGYAGLDLIKILLGHPEADIVYLGARREERPPITQIWPSLRHRIDMPCALLGSDPVPEMDVVFLALPHTVAMKHTSAFLDRGVRVIDISADHRLKDPAVYKKWYGKEHAEPRNLSRAVYGLCEFHREEIAGADLVANPGCYPTGAQIAVAPLLKNGLLRPEGRLIIDAKSGLSGAGRTPTPALHFPEANESVTAYRVCTHQHTGEMLQALAEMAAAPVNLIFVPHLVPLDRGILVTAYVPLTAAADTAALERLYGDLYRNEPFVRVCEDDAIPNTKHVMGTNFADVAVRAAGDVAVAIAVIDNLVKGAAGQAVQNMNIMFGLDETLGLM